MGTEMVKRFILILLILLAGQNVAYTKDKVIAVVLASNLSKYKIAYESFTKTVKDNKLDTGIQFVLSTPNPDPASWTNALKRAEGYDVDVIIAFGSPLVHSAIKEKISVPLIFADVYERQMIEGARGMKIGGVYNNIPLSTPLKNLFIMKNVKTLHVLYSPYEVESEMQAYKVKELAAADNVNCELHPLKTASGFGNFKLDAGDAIFITSSILLEGGISRIVAYGATHNAPVIGMSELVVNRGGLLSLAPDPHEQGVALARYLHNYLGKTSQMMPPNIQVTKVNLIINLEAAKKNNIVVPFSVLNAATKVIK
jgi:putative ABC transport system substrate-binding protein